MSGKTKNKIKLKQIRTEDLSEDQSSFLNRHFPEFAFQERHPFEGDKDLKNVDVIMTPFGIRRLNEGRTRRYSGGKSLSRGRYYTICQGLSKSDQNTLQRELTAYWSYEIKSPIFPVIMECSDYDQVLQNLLLFEEDAGKVGAAVAVLNERLGKAALNDFLLLFQTEITKDFRPRNLIGHIIPLPLSFRKIDNTDILDLRTEIGQKLFLTEIIDKPNFDYSALPDHVKLSERQMRTMDFGSILPTMLSQELGGDAFHDDVGNRVRSLGFGGLVYPSARTDSMTLSRKDHVKKHKGWIFVDYADTEPVAETAKVRPWRWLRQDDIAMKAGIFTQGEYIGFFTEGVDATNIARLKEDAELALKGLGRQHRQRMFRTNKGFEYEFANPPHYWYPEEEE